MVESLEVSEDDPEADPEAPERGAMAIKLLASVSDDNRDAIVDEGALPPLVGLLESDDAGAQREACAALANLMNDNSHIKEMVMDEGGLTHFVNLLASPEPAVQEQAAFALKSVVGENMPSLERAVIDAKALPGLVAILASEDASPEQAAAKRRAAEVLTTLATTSVAHRKLVYEAEAVAPLLEMLPSEEPGVHIQAAEALLKLNLFDKAKEDMVNYGIIERLRKLMTQFDDIELLESVERCLKEF